MPANALPLIQFPALDPHVIIRHAISNYIGLQPMHIIAREPFLDPSIASDPIVFRRRRSGERHLPPGRRTLPSERALTRSGRNSRRTVIVKRGTRPAVAQLTPTGHRLRQRLRARRGVQVAGRPPSAQIADQGHRIEQAALLDVERALLIEELGLLRLRHGGVVDRARLNSAMAISVPRMASCTAVRGPWTGRRGSAAGEIIPRRLQRR